MILSGLMLQAALHVHLRLDQLAPCDHDRILSRTDSKVEITGFEARHYDALMDLVTAGTYRRFLRCVVCDMAIQPREAILDLASATVGARASNSVTA
jgi:hypothetical protein